MIENFVIIINGEKSLTVVAKLSILDVFRGPDYASGWLSSYLFRNVLSVGV